MNLVDIILIAIIAILFILAARYSMSHASCEACDGQSCGVGHGKHHHKGGGCQHCNYKEIEEQEIPERFRLKK